MVEEGIIPKAVKLFASMEKGYTIVRFPVNLNNSFYDKKQGRMVQYKEIVTPEEIKEAKKWLKKHGFEYNHRAGAWVKEGCL